MKSLILASLLIGANALAQEAVQTPLIRSSSEIETSCRSKAKEIAAETYRSCVSDQKNAQIEQIKKEYQAKLQALKAHYESEIKKMNGAKTKAALDETDATSAVPATLEKSEKKAEEPVVNEVPKVPAKKTTRKSVTPAKPMVSKPAPAAGKSAAASKPASKRATKKIETATVTEMTVQLKPAPVAPATDESIMDLPEPIPVEDMNTSAENAI